MSRFMTIIALLLSLSACRKITADKAAEGKRLKLITLKDDAGNEQLSGFYDTQLKIDCELVADDPNGDGTRFHCLPRNRLYQNEIFVDPGCQKPLAVISHYLCFDEAPQYAQIAHRDAPQCGAGEETYTYHKLGARTQVSAVYHRDAQGACALEDNAAIDFAADAFYLVGESVPLGAFAGAERKTEKLGARLSAYVVHSEDGASQLISGTGFWGSAYFFDAGEAGDCYLHAGAAPRCMPTKIVIANDGSTFADAACTTKLYTQIDTCTAAPFTYAMQPAGPPVDGCTAPYDIFKVKPAAAVYVQNGPQCNAYQDTPSPPAVATRYTLADKVQLDAFVSFTPSAPTAAKGALRVDSYKGSDGSVVPYRYFDTKHGAPCELREVSKTESYCLPPTAFVAYADAACAEPVAVTFAHQCDPNWVNPSYGISYDVGACPRPVTLYKLGAEIAKPAALYYKSLSGCAKNVVSDGEHYYQVSVQALSEFPKMTLARP